MTSQHKTGVQMPCTGDLNMVSAILMLSVQAFRSFNAVSTDPSCLEIQELFSSIPQ
jgi:hypothetical protein